MKCLEKDRSRRYATANGFAADLRRHLENQPVLARPPGTGYLLSRFVRRHKIGFAAVAAVSVALLAGIAAAIWGMARAEVEATKTRLANEANQYSLHLASMADYASAVKGLDEDLEATRKGQRALGFAGKSRWHEGVALLIRALEREPGNHLPALKLYDTLRRRQAAKRDWSLHTLKHAGPVRSASFSPDGTRIVTASEDQTARIWDAATGQPVGEPMRHQGVVNTASFGPDGSRIVTASADRTARLWDAATSRAVGQPMRHEHSVTTASFSPDGSRVVTASGDKTAWVWDAATGQPVGEPMRHDRGVTSAVFSPDGARVVTADTFEGTARIWEVATGHTVSQPMEMRIDKCGVRSASFSPDGLKIVCVHFSLGYGYWGDSDRPGEEPVGIRARIWDVETGQPVGLDLITGFWNEDKGKLSARFSPDGTTVITASDDRTARVWDAASGKAIGEPMRHKGSVNRANFSPDADLVITASDDFTAQVWDAKTRQAIFGPLRHEREVRDAGFSPDRTRVVTAGDDGTARVWELPANEALGDDVMLDWVWNSTRTSTRFNGVYMVFYRSGNYDGSRYTPEEHPDDTRVSARKLTEAESAAIVAITPGILGWARSFSGIRFSEDGELHLIRDEERLATMTAVALPDGPWADLAKWINTPSPQRSIDPKLNITLRQIAERERDYTWPKGVGEGTLESLDSALRNDPTVPLARLILAGVLENEDAATEAKDRDSNIPQRAAFLRRYDLDELAWQTGRMKNDELAALWVRAANHLLGLPPETKIGVGPKPTTAWEEAGKAARKALELVPGSPAAEEVLNKLKP
jgi:WD40 repeat protein